MYYVWVDGARQPDAVTVFPGVSTLPVAAGLAAGSPHAVRVVYATDPVYNTWPNVTCIGCTQAVVAVATDGGFGPPPPRRPRALLVIGDSITAGNNARKPCTNASTCDVTVGYGSLLCDRFDAACTTLAVSSKGGCPPTPSLSPPRVSAVN